MLLHFFQKGTIFSSRIALSNVCIFHILPELPNIFIKIYISKLYTNWHHWFLRFSASYINQHLTSSIVSFIFSLANFLNLRHIIHIKRISNRSACVLLKLRYNWHTIYKFWVHTTVIELLYIVNFPPISEGYCWHVCSIWFWL